MKLYLHPHFNAKDKGEGGIRRVWEAQHKYLPEYGIEIVSDQREADLVAIHADDIRTDRPTVLHCHGLYYTGYDWERWSYEANAKIIGAMKRAEAVSVPSKWVAHSLRRGMLIDPAVLYHGVDIDEWEPGENHNYIFWGKNRPDAVCDPEQVNQIAKLCPELTFITTFGDESLPNVKTLGRIPYDKAKELIRSAGVYLGTVKETGGITCLESLAAGVPIAGFNWGANSEIVLSGETGYLVKPGDYSALREAIYYCLEQRDRLGDNARQHVQEQFQWKDRIQDYLPFYRRALESFKSPRPKVSIIVTAYNLAKYLPECLDSVLNQSFSDWECIIVDDASPDECGQIADRYAAKDSRFRAIHNPTNQYLAGARNTGISQSRGQYILPLDADDQISPDTLRILSQTLDEDRNKDIVTGAFELIEPSGKHWVSTWPPKNPSYDEQIKGHNQVPYASMYRRWVWERTGGYRRRWRSAEDAEFWTRAMSYGAVPAHVTGMPTLIYNNRPSSMSHSIPTPDWTSWFIWSKYPQFEPYGASVSRSEARHVMPYGPAELTVIIPVGPGHEPYLQDALDSLVNQTFQNWEVIVVNDTGIPFSANILRGYPFAKVIESEGKARGPALSRNVGIDHSRTPAFVLLDADDYAQPLFLDVLYEAWKKYGGWCYTDFLDHEGTYKETEDFVYEKALNHMPGPSTGIYSKADWELVGGFDESVTWWEDYDFQLLLMGHGICGSRIKYAGFTYRYLSGKRREDAWANQKQALAEIRKKHKILYEGGCYN